VEEQQQEFLGVVDFMKDFRQLVLAG